MHSARNSIIFCAGILLLFLTCTSQVASLKLQEQLIPFETLAHGFVSGVGKREELIINERRPFKRLWRKVFSIGSEKPALPDVDFERQMVIGVFFGETGDSSTSVSITKISEDGDTLRVFRKETLGNPQCPGPPIPGQPYHLVATERIKKPEKNVSFEPPEQAIRVCRQPEPHEE